MNHRRQQGFTLVELIGVVSLTALLMTVAVALLHGLLKWSDGAADAQTHAEATARLEHTLRNLLPDARTISVDGQVLRIEQPDQSAEFTLTGDTCQLVVTGQGSEESFERFEVGPHDAWRLQQDDRLVTIALSAAADSRLQPFRVVVARRLAEEDQQ